jgi:protein AbiQ
LTLDFYNNNDHLKEIEKKVDRPYSVFVVDINNLTFAIPLRSSIRHDYFFPSSNITNAKKRENISNGMGNAGLDFSKAVIVEKRMIYEQRQA